MYRIYVREAVSVIWTQTAVDHFKAIEEYIAQTSPKYAQAVIQRIVHRTDQLTTFPRLGAEVAEFRDESVREVLEHPYRIIWRMEWRTLTGDGAPIIGVHVRRGAVIDALALVVKRAKKSD